MFVIEFWILYFFVESKKEVEELNIVLDCYLKSKYYFCVDIERLRVILIIGF